MKRVLILVEGQTEERFVKDTLGPHLAAIGLAMTPTLLTTKCVKSGGTFKGGVTSFDKFAADTHRLLRGAGRDGCVTTMLDYYRLPADFPGMDNRPHALDYLLRVQHVQQAIAAYFDDRRLLPFLALHEFEAWLFSCAETLPNLLDSAKHLQFGLICTGLQTPEQINERPGHNPAARIESLFPSYRKTLHGPTAAARIGLPLIRSRCPHFARWLERLEAFAKG